MKFFVKLSDLNQTAERQTEHKEHCELTDGDKSALHKKIGKIKASLIDEEKAAKKLAREPKIRS